MWTKKNEIMFFRKRYLKDKEEMIKKYSILKECKSRREQKKHINQILSSSAYRDIIEKMFDRFILKGYAECVSVESVANDLKLILEHYHFNPQIESKEYGFFVVYISEDFEIM